MTSLVVSAGECASYPFCSVAKGSSVSWVAKFKGDQKFRMQAVKRAVAKLQGDKTASFIKEMSGLQSYREINLRAEKTMTATDVTGI